MARRSADNPLALVVMGLLIEQPMHPYQMAAVLRERGKDTTVRVNRGSLYDVVSALEREDWITARETVKDGSRPSRTVYALTDAGHTEFLSRLDTELCAPQPEYPRFITAVSYLGALGPARAAEVLHTRAAALEASIAADQATLTEVLESGKAPRLHVIEAEYALHMARAELAWVRDIARQSRDGALPWPTDHLSPEGDPT